MARGTVDESRMDEVLKELRQIVNQVDVKSPKPAPFKVEDDSPAPWSVRPPGGFKALREALNKSSKQ